MWGCVEFKDVDFFYMLMWFLIENFNLIVELGEIIVIVGWIGVGKLILVNLLMCFYEVDCG